MFRRTPRQVFSKTQLFFICFGIVAQLSFAASIRHYANTGSWGYPRIGWFIPDRIVSFGGFEAHSNLIITYHAIASYSLYIGLLLQLCIMLFLKRTAIMQRVHRAIGMILICLCLPLFLGFSLSLDIALIQNPINKILFGIIPLIVLYGLLTSVFAIRSGDKALHVDGIFTAIMLLNTASLFRLLMGVLFVSGVPLTFLFTHNEPNHITAIMRTCLMALILTASFYSCGRLRQNRFPIIVLATSVLLAILIAVYKAR